MNILIPEIVSEKHINEIKAVSTKVEVSRLRIVAKESLLRKVMRKIVVNFFTYDFYLKFQSVLEPKHQYTYFIDQSQIKAQRKKIQALLVTPDMTAANFKELADKLPNLEWVHSIKTGTDHIDANILKERKIKLTRTKGVHSQRIAEFIMAGIFEVTKHISAHVDLKKKRRWAEIQSEELAGKTIGILGIGSIGCEVAKIAKGLRMNVIGYNSSVKPNDDFQIIFGKEDLKAVLMRSDYVVICLPLTDKTKGLINLDKFKLMKPESYIVNVGRSEVIDEKDLIEAAQSGLIKGAILDVFHHGMQLPNHPFYKMDNILLTHFSAHSSSVSTDEVYELYKTNVSAFLNGGITGEVIE